MDWIKELLTMFWEYLKFWVVINHYEEGVILRNGNYLKTLGPGFYLKAPFIDRVLSMDIKPDTREYEAVAITTLDGKTVSIGLMIEFEVIDVKLYLLDTNDSASNMRDIAKGELSDLLEDFNWVDVKKKTTKNALKRILSDKYKSMGVDLKDLKFTNKSESKVYKLYSDKESIY